MTTLTVASCHGAASSEIDTSPLVLASVFGVDNKAKAWMRLPPKLPELGVLMVDWPRGAR